MGIWPFTSALSAYLTSNCVCYAVKTTAVCESALGILGQAARPKVAAEPYERKNGFSAIHPVPRCLWANGLAGLWFLRNAVVSEPTWRVRLFIR